MRTGLCERAGELFEQARLYREAMDAYRQGGAYRRAVELARTSFPGEVVGVEEEWGAWLCGRRQYEAAIVHYIEAGLAIKALEAAILGRQWTKAAQIADAQDPSVAGPYYQQIAEHYSSVKDCEVSNTLNVHTDLWS